MGHHIITQVLSGSVLKIMTFTCAKRRQTWDGVKILTSLWMHTETESRHNANIVASVITTPLLSIERADWSKLHAIYKARDATLSLR